MSLQRTVDERSLRWAAAHFFRLCDFMVPKDDRVVIVTFPDGDDQGVAVCLELHRLKWRGEIHWLVDADPKSFTEWQEKRGLGHVKIRFLRRLSLAGIWTYLRARYVFYTHGALFNYAPPSRKLVVNLWHGMPIKRIWRGVPGSQAPMSTFGPERLLTTGLPRNEFLLTHRQRSIDLISALRGDADRLIFFLPTYRTSGRGLKTEDGTETNSLLGLKELDAQKLHAWLKANRCKLIFKPHPMSVNAGKQFVDDAHWAMIDEKSLFKSGLGLYEVLAQADLLVTDVSSVCVDFLVTQKPQILYFPDMRKYEATRGLLLHPLRDYAPGPIASTFAELQAALDVWLSGDDPWRDQRKRLRDLMVPASSKSATASLFTALGMHASKV
jgi:CDP-glycerol glycerophosphotransferase (TagB/SpsB family)